MEVEQEKEIFVTTAFSSNQLPAYYTHGLANLDELEKERRDKEKIASAKKTKDSWKNGSPYKMGWYIKVRAYIQYDILFFYYQFVTKRIIRFVRFIFKKPVIIHPNDRLMVELYKGIKKG